MTVHGKVVQAFRKKAEKNGSEPEFGTKIPKFGLAESRAVSKTNLLHWGHAR